MQYSCGQMVVVTLIPDSRIEKPESFLLLAQSSIFDVVSIDALAYAFADDADFPFRIENNLFEKRKNPNQRFYCIDAYTYSQDLGQMHWWWEPLAIEWHFVVSLVWIAMHCLSLTIDMLNHFSVCFDARCCICIKNNMQNVFFLNGDPILFVH